MGFKLDASVLLSFVKLLCPCTFGKGLGLDSASTFRVLRVCAHVRVCELKDPGPISLAAGPGELYPDRPVLFHALHRWLVTEAVG